MFIDVYRSTIAINTKDEFMCSVQRPWSEKGHIDSTPILNI